MNQPQMTLAAFEPWEIEAYLDGETTPRLAAYLANNPAAISLLRAEQARTSTLRKALYRFDCPSPLTLQAYALGELATLVHRQVATHLPTCPQCTAEFASLQAVVDEPAMAPNRALLLTTLQENFNETMQTLVAGMRMIVATLVSSGAPPLAGVALRGASVTPAPAQLFTTDEVEIMIMTHQQSKDRYSVDGQLFTAMPLTNATFTLTPDEQESAMITGAIDNSGVFVVNDLPPGIYQFVFVLLDQVVVIPNLAVS